MNLDNSIFSSDVGSHTLLNQLVHHCLFDESLLLVLGEADESAALYYALSDELQATSHVCCIEVAPQASKLQVLMELSIALGLNSDGDEEQLLTRINHLCQARGPHEPAIQLLVSNTHDLNKQTLELLINLIQEHEGEIRSFQLALFGEPSLVQRVADCKTKGMLVHPIYLSGEHDSADSHDSRLSQSSPVIKMIAAGVLFAGLLLAFLYQDSLWNEKPEPAHSSEVWTKTVVEKSINNDTILDDVDSKDELSVPEEPVIEDMVLENTESERKAPDGEAEEELVESPLEAMVESPLDAMDEAVDETIKTETETETEAASVAELESEASFNELMAEDIDSVDTAVIAAKPSAPEPQLQEESVQALTITEDEFVILGFKPGFYTLQVLGAKSETVAKDFVQRQPNAKELYIYSTRHKEDDWFMVVFGEFSSYGAARRSIASLPAEQRKGQPWPRRLSQVQSEIESFRGL